MQKRELKINTMKSPSEFIKEMIISVASIYKSAAFKYEYDVQTEAHFVFIEPAVLLEDDIFMEDLAAIKFKFYDDYPTESLAFVSEEYAIEPQEPELTILPTEPFEISLTKSLSSEKPHVKSGLPRFLQSLREFFTVRQAY